MWDKQRVVGLIACTVGTLALTGCGMTVVSPTLAGAKNPPPIFVAHHAHDNQKKPGGADASRGPVIHAVAVSVSSLSRSSQTAQSSMPYSDLEAVAYSSSGLILVSGAWYVAPLGVDERMAYVVLPQGIAWATERVATTGGRPSQTQAQEIYFSPIGLGGTRARPAPLQKQVLVKRRNDGSSGYLTLYNWHEGVVYTLVDGSGKTQREALYFTLPGSTPVFLAQTSGSQPTLTLQTTDSGLLYAFGQIQDGAVRLSEAGYLSAQTKLHTALTASVWPLTIYQSNPSSVTILSGPTSFTIASGTTKVTTAAAPIDPMFTSLVSHSPISAWPQLYLPSAAWQFSPAQADVSPITLAQVSSDYYDMVLTTPTHDTIYLQVNRETSASKDLPVSSRTRGDGMILQSISPYFGSFVAQHVFVLSSLEGPMVQWEEALSKNEGTKWFATFNADGWRYEVGPFHSPADRQQTSQLRAWLSLFANSAPLPLGTGGQVDIRLGYDGSVQSKVVFSPASNLKVTASGPALSPLSALTQWTIVAHA